MIRNANSSLDYRSFGVLLIFIVYLVSSLSGGNITAATKLNDLQGYVRQCLMDSQYGSTFSFLFSQTQNYDSDFDEGNSLVNFNITTIREKTRDGAQNELISRLQTQMQAQLDAQIEEFESKSKVKTINQGGSRRKRQFQSIEGQVKQQFSQWFDEQLGQPQLFSKAKIFEDQTANKGNTALRLQLDPYLNETLRGQ